jgi:FdhD protein
MNAHQKIKIVQYRDGSSSETDDFIASEKKLRIFSNEHEILSLMCTPTMVKELVIGFGLSEGLLKQHEQQQEWCSERIEIFWRDEEIEVHLPIAVPESAATLTSGCAKGVTFASNEKLSAIQDGFHASTGAIIELYKRFQKKSELFRTTGGVHAAALCDEEDILIFAEDIGRHNAVDKIIGYAFLENIPMQKKILLLSGRLSSEIINKAVRAQVPLLISRAAPTDLAVEIAKKYNVTLIGFLRGQKLNIYSKPDRLKQ